jgi:hypothetical protein
VVLRASGLINEIYGVHILLELNRNFINVVRFCGITGIVTGCLRLCSTLTSVRCNTVMVVGFLFHRLKNFFISVSCQRFPEAVESCSQEIKKSLSKEPLRQNTGFQLQLSSRQTSNTTIVFTAFDLFTTNLSVVFTFVSSETAYVIMLMCLKSP